VALYSPPSASVVVVNWNRCGLLERCLRSLAAQTAPPFEVILVDNGSGDGSVEMALAQYSNTPAFSLSVIRNQENQGFCRANNQAFEQARGEFIALLNNDAEANPDWLASLLAAFDDRPELGMAASKILVYEDPDIIDKAGHVIYLDGQNWGRGHGEPDIGQFEEVEETLWPDGCAAMYRRAMLKSIGGFDEDLFAYGDDAELGLRARIAGWGCLYIPTAVVRHHRGSTLGKLSMRRVELIERNRVLLAVKHFPWSLLCLNTGYFCARLVAGSVAALTGRGETGHFPGWKGKLTLARAICSANWQALKLTPRTLRKRWAFRAQRKLTPSQVKSLLLRHRVPLWKMMGGEATR
jgi:GT2 family glycosyltransferase